MDVGQNKSVLLNGCVNHVVKFKSNDYSHARIVEEMARGNKDTRGIGGLFSRSSGPCHDGLKFSSEGKRGTTKRTFESETMHSKKIRSSANPPPYQNPLAYTIISDQKPLKSPMTIHLPKSRNWKRSLHKSELETYLERLSNVEATAADAIHHYKVFFVI